MARWQYVTCHYCRGIVRRKVRSSKDSAKYCSRECSFKAQSMLKKERMTIRRIGAEMRKKRRTIDIIKRRQAKAEKYGAYIKEALECVCKDCGAEFHQRTYLGRKEEYCTSCREKRAVVHKRRSSRISKSNRRARKRATQIEPIDPLDVFERDKWKCYLCGCDTPKELRGSIEDNAPELEHIIPLSKHGTHTLRNVACACRRCNLEKGDSIYVGV